jgi:RNA polymerase sigma factor (TIGR02999 family)
MSVTSRLAVTRTLLELGSAASADPRLIDRLFELVYEELHDIAAALLRRERSGHTLRPTALIHEAYLRLIDESQLSWENRRHFFGIAVRAMRQILVTHARRKSRVKRGGQWRQVTLDERLGAEAPSFFEILALDEALNRLAELDRRTAQVAELRMFTGLTMKEVAAVLGISKRTADGEWAVAKKWLRREMA